jgi:uncharacterized protein (DUF1501 family)
MATRTTLTRRRVGLGSLGLALGAFASGAGESLRRRFLFVHAEGGWDPLCVFAPLFSASAIDMEPDAQPLSVGGFALVDSPARPAVPAFFQRWGDRTLLLNGLSTRSVNHETCAAVALTGSTSDSNSDWATLLAANVLADHYLPHVVLNGPSFPGAYTIAVSHAQGLVQDAVHGTLLEGADAPLALPSDAAARRVADLLERRAATLAAARPDLALLAGQQEAMGRARRLVDEKDLIEFGYAATLRERADNAIRLLADGVSRCATLSTYFVWDTHTANAGQTPLFQELFGDLDYILDALATTTDGAGNTLADDTVVVVLSEMGRTPAYNGTLGRDHWPYTSALVIGPGITGGRTIGGYTDLYAGIGVDPASGELDPARAGIDAKSFGATLLALGDVDPGQYLGSAEVLTGVLG